jgi:crotonobetainyl-CoA:carnitine CoA-transferase CaiB-like acyl-CoA transferase
MSGTSTHMRPWVPGVGEHTQAVLRDILKLDDAALEQLRAAGTFGSSTP